MLWISPLVLAAVLHACLAAYIPSRVLFLHEGPEEAVKEVWDMVTSEAAEVRSLRMDHPKFEFPRLFKDGRRAYSHVAIVGRGTFLTSADYRALAQFAEGTLDPSSSKLVDDQKYVLPNLDYVSSVLNEGVDPRTHRLATVFEPLPGANIMVVTDSFASFELKSFLKSLGAIASPLPAARSAEPATLKMDLSFINSLNAGEVSGCSPFRSPETFEPIEVSPESVLQVKFAFKNLAVPQQRLWYVDDDSAAVAIWRGADNNARIVFLGILQTVADTNAMYDSSVQHEGLSMPISLIPHMFDLGAWWTWQRCVLRVSSFDAVPVPNPTRCPNAMKIIEGQNQGNTAIMEGQLVYLRLKIEELVDKRWVPYIPRKRYPDIAAVAASVGYQPGLHPAETAQISEQKGAIDSGIYDICLQDARDNFNMSPEAKVAAFEARKNDPSPGLRPNKWEVQAFDNASQVCENFTDVQLTEAIMGTSFAVPLSLIDPWEGVYDAVMLPDLVRSYHLKLDYNRNGYNRLHILDHVGVNMNRVDASQWAFADMVWFTGILSVSVLAFYASLVMATTFRVVPE